MPLIDTSDPKSSEAVSRYSQAVQEATREFERAKQEVVDRFNDAKKDALTRLNRDLDYAQAEPPYRVTCRISGHGAFAATVTSDGETVSVAPISGQFLAKQE